MCISQQSGACLGYSVSVMFREFPESTGSECLGSMTPETQDFYLRMDHHHRRSGYRLGRIIARQQLLKKIAGGRSLDRSDSSDCGLTLKNQTFIFSFG